MRCPNSRINSSQNPPSQPAALQLQIPSLSPSVGFDVQRIDVLRGHCSPAPTLLPVSSSWGSSTAQHSAATEGAEQGHSQRPVPPPFRPVEVALPIPWAAATSCCPHEEQERRRSPLCFSRLLLQLAVADQLPAGRERQMCP